MIRDSWLQAWHRSLLFGSVGLISIAAWLALWRFGLTLHGPVHHHAASDPTLVLLFVGAWTVMTVAMMLPTSVPLIATFDTIASERPDRSLLVVNVHRVPVNHGNHSTRATDGVVGRLAVGVSVAGARTGAGGACDAPTDRWAGSRQTGG